MGLVAAQEVLAQAFGVREPVFGKVAHHGAELGRQFLQKRDLPLGRGAPGFGRRAGLPLAQLGQPLPALQQRWIQRHRLIESRLSLLRLSQRQVVVAGFLLRPAEARTRLGHLRQVCQGPAPVAQQSLRHGERVAGFAVVRRFAQQGPHGLGRCSRLAAAEQPLRLANAVLALACCRVRRRAGCRDDGHAPTAGRAALLLAATRSGRRSATPPCADAARTPAACSGRRSASPTLSRCRCCSGTAPPTNRPAPPRRRGCRWWPPD